MKEYWENKIEDGDKGFAPFLNYELYSYKSSKKFSLSQGLGSMKPLAIGNQLHGLMHGLLSIKL